MGRSPFVGEAPIFLGRSPPGERGSQYLPERGVENEALAVSLSRRTGAFLAPGRLLSW